IYYYPTLRALPSFPTRRSSDLYADRIIDLYTELAPNFKRAVIDRQVIGPHDMEKDLGLIGGNIFHGELSVDQLFHMRPAPGYARSEEHTSELQSRFDLVCRLLL